MSKEFSSFSFSSWSHTTRMYLKHEILFSLILLRSTSMLLKNCLNFLRWTFVLQLYIQTNRIYATKSRLTIKFNMPLSCETNMEGRCQHEGQDRGIQKYELSNQHQEMCGSKSNSNFKKVWKTFYPERFFSPF